MTTPNGTDSIVIRQTEGRGLRLMLGLLVAMALSGLLATIVGAGEGTTGPVPPPAKPPFYWVQPAQRPQTAVLAQPARADLSILWIERTPRYPRYCLDYSRDLPELCPGSEDAKHFPEPGELVTFTAHIANQGIVGSPAVSTTWSISGPRRRLPLAVQLQPLAPGATATLSLAWSWQALPHTVTLALDPSNVISETSRANNQRSHRTGALYLDILVHPLVHQAFASRPNLAGSWSFADWIQAQFEAMNRVLAAAVYPEAPQGIVDRVRIDRIAVTEDVGGATVASGLEVDGRWTFRVERDDPDTPEDEGMLSAEAYARAYAQAIDWGLIHELSHQLGVIDLYQLNVFGSFQNELLDNDGRPLLLGFLWPNPGLMGGGDRGDHPWNSYSKHTALALNRHAGLRRGYFGEYLYDLPAQSSIQVLDNRGQPLTGGRVDFFQTEWGVVGAQPAHSGTLNAEGRYLLPDRPVPLGGLTTATGHTLAPNPFGPINVVGFNGQSLVQVSQGDQRFYAWWPITDFNLAFWQGTAAYERILRTHLPPIDAPAPPVDLHGLVDGPSVSLSWPASPSAGVIEYRVYRGQEPDYYPFTQVATTTQRTYGDLSLRTARYAVTAVDQEGRESGFSAIFRAQRTVDPVGIFVDQASGQRTILDRHDGALITQLADDRWIGRQGSLPIGLTGSQAMGLGEPGLMLIPVTSEDRLVVLNDQREAINWFGRERFVTGTLMAPAGVASAGEPFTIAIRPSADANTLGLASFDVDLRLSGDPPWAFEGVTPVPGRHGAALHVDDDDRLLYRATGQLEPAEGSLQLWVRPDWPWDDGQDHVFVEIGQEHAMGGYRLRLAKAAWNGLYAWLSDGRHDITLYAGIKDWQRDEWHHLAVAWQVVQRDSPYHRYTLWVDGMLLDSQVLRRPVTGPFDLLSVGSGLDNADQAAADLDELHLSRIARVGNSQRALLAVSQSNADRVELYDWLGNQVSQLGSRGDGSGQFWEPREVVRVGERLLVADSRNGRLQVLALEGSRLTWQASWSDGLVRPQGLASLDDGRVLVSDRGDHQVKLLAADGTLLRRWSGPDDGHLGHFWLPAGLSLLPSDDVLVADAGNGRVVRITGPLTPARIYLPLLMMADPTTCHLPGKPV